MKMSLLKVDAEAGEFCLHLKLDLPEDHLWYPPELTVPLPFLYYLTIEEKIEVIYAKGYWTKPNTRIMPKSRQFPGNPSKVTDFVL
jgi:hypothetical protein